ncbi:hypothetical protein K440DRAFT_627255 [Wilcoxina mikolae CBS 423.85]|nr:hypothetical protein K440DRAFT_627255 [Wilcoxina mikolae CBS 423.85]
MITLFIIHQIVIYSITIWMFTTKYFNDVAPEEPETTYTSQRQSSKEKLTPHLMKTTAVFWSLICVERTWHEMCYWVIDLIYTSIRIWQPSLWSWTMLVIMSSSIHWQLLGKILGPIYTLAFFFAWWLLAILCGWLRIYAFFNFMWSWTVTPIANGIWWLLNFLGAYIAYGINFAVSVITAILPTLGTRSIILLACSPVVMLVAVFGLTIMDPFRLGRARRMCRKAARTATKAYYSHTKDRRPILQQLGWKAADGQIESEVLKKVLWNLSAIRYISDTDNAEEDKLEVLLRDLPGMSAHNVET